MRGAPSFGGLGLQVGLITNAVLCDEHRAGRLCGVPALVQPIEPDATMTGDFMHLQQEHIWILPEENHGRAAQSRWLLDVTKHFAQGHVRRAARFETVPELLDEDCFVPGWRGDCSCPATLAVARAGWAPVIRMPKPTPRCRRQNLHFAVLKNAQTLEGELQLGSLDLAIGRQHNSHARDWDALHALHLLHEHDHCVLLLELYETGLLLKAS